MGHIGRTLGCLGIALVVISTPARADVPEAQRAEVAHLLTFIETAGCEMERNGTRHLPDEARRHVARKYAHFQGRITNTEQFIALAASQSTVSGKPYRAICPGKAPVPTADWLREELQRFRKRPAP